MYHYLIFLAFLGVILDREDRDSFSFIAVAKDQGGLSASALIAVNIIDVNDNSPVFLPTDYSAQISWNTEKGNWNHVSSSPILSVRATDADDKGPNSEISYEIVDGNDEGLFSLNPKSGILKLTGRLVYSNILFLIGNRNVCNT